MLDFNAWCPRYEHRGLFLRILLHNLLSNAALKYAEVSRQPYVKVWS